ncbi:hypothetical protein Tco_0385525 [Tanacetum coccineum]
MKIHHGGRFTDLPRRKYVDGEHDKSVLDLALNVDDLDTQPRPSNILGHQNDEGEVRVADEGHNDEAEDEDGGEGEDYKANYGDESEDDEAEDRGESKVDEAEDEGQSEEKDEAEDGGQSEENDEADDEDKDVKDIVDEENIVDELEVQMNGFKFEVEGEYVDPMQPNLNMTETDLEVLDFDSFESDVEDSKEVDLAKEMVRAHDVETRRNIMIVKNDKIRIRVKCALKDGFRASRREMLGLDGAFIKGQYPRPLTPTVTSIFRPIKNALVEFTVDWNGADLCQVKVPYGEQCVVNLNQRVCSCRKWEVSGISYKHVVACNHDMIDNGMDVGLPEDWVHQSYTLQTWRDVYSFKVNPVNGSPPKKKKKSVRDIDMVKDGKLTRKGKTVTFLLCKGTGHNRRTCKSNTGIQGETSQASSNKRARTNQETGGNGGIGTQAGTQVTSQSASQVGGNVVGSQEAATMSPMKRTKKSASRLTPTK